MRVSDEHKNKPTILIADDSEMNRSILADMLEDEYEIMEAEDGVQAIAAIQKYSSSISLLLLDIVMPQMDGFEVLSMMNRQQWIEDIPVIMISAESSSEHVERAYGLGITDFITRPFDALVVHRRVVNTVMLYAKQRRLKELVADQVREKERQSNLMIDVLSHIVEFRNGESGLHVLHIHTLTELMLRCLSKKKSPYLLPEKIIALITKASTLHDIGKISIDSKILNKPGRLTSEEFEIMKTHAVVGEKMLLDLPVHQEEPLIKTACEICRWHHERWDGRGYPDGLKGDEIPVSAQVVALADVYDALTSERVYKNAIPHEQAVEMILNGECGAFNPLLLECLTEVADNLPIRLQEARYDQAEEREVRAVTEEILRREEMPVSDRTLSLLEHERMKNDFYAIMSQEVQFEYTVQPSMVTISAWGAKEYGLDETIMDPLHDKKALAIAGYDGVRMLSDAVRSTNPENPVIQCDWKLNVDGETQWTRFFLRSVWNHDEPPRYTGAIGKAVNIHEEHTRIEDLEWRAGHDSLTGLFNHACAKKRIIERLNASPNGRFAMVIFDMDRFKDANDTHGHMFGDELLVHVAEKLRQSTRVGDITARVGGDEFLIFQAYKGEI